MAVSVSHETNAVTVVVYSARYPHNFDALLDGVQQFLAYTTTTARRLEGPVCHVGVFDQRRGHRFTNKLPACLSCFDCKSDKEHEKCCSWQSLCCLHSAGR